MALSSYCQLPLRPSCYLSQTYVEKGRQEQDSNEVCGEFYIMYIYRMAGPEKWGEGGRGRSIIPPSSFYFACYTVS